MIPNKTKKKINVLEWLNNSSNLKPTLLFDNLADNISILDSDIELLFNSDFYDVLNEIFIRNFPNAIKHECSLKETIKMNSKWNKDYNFTKIP